MTNIYLVTYKADGDFMAEFMNVKQIANLYGCDDINDTTDHKVYRLAPDKEPERLNLQASWVQGIGHVVQLWEPDESEMIDEAEVIEH